MLEEVIIHAFETNIAALREALKQDVGELNNRITTVETKIDRIDLRMHRLRVPMDRLEKTQDRLIVRILQFEDVSTLFATRDEVTRLRDDVHNGLDRILGILVHLDQKYSSDHATVLRIEKTLLQHTHTIEEHQKRISSLEHHNL